MQPYQHNTSTVTAQNEYTAVCDGVENWVERHLDLILDNPTNFQVICKALKQNPDLLSPLRSLMKATDFSAIAFKDTDIHVVVAVIMRFLHRNVLGSGLYGIPQHESKFLGCIAEGMRALLPRRGKQDLFVLCDISLIAI